MSGIKRNIRNDPVIKGLYPGRQDTPMKGEILRQDSTRLVLKTFVS